MGELDGKVAVITGGATGIGLGSARALAREGARVVLFGPDRAPLDSAAAETGGVGIVGDVASGASVAALFAEVESRFGRVDVVVNSAAIQPYGTVETMDEAGWDRVLGVNLKGIYLTSHHAVPMMRNAGGGAIVNIASVQGIACQTNLAAYVASKGAVLALTRAMALDHAKGLIPIGQSRRIRSITGGTFTGKVVGPVEFPAAGAVTVEVGGRGHLAGEGSFVIEADDPLGHGFALPKRFAEIAG